MSTRWVPVRSGGMDMATCRPRWSNVGAAVWRQGDGWVSCPIGEGADATHDIERHGSDRETARAEALALWCPR